MHITRQKHRKITVILMIVLSILLSLSYFEQVNRAAEQIGRINPRSAGQSIPLGSRYHRSVTSFLLPCTEETRGMTREQHPEYLRKLGESIRYSQARQVFFALFLWFFVLTAYCLSRRILRTSLSVRFYHHAIISYIHDQGGHN